MQSIWFALLGLGLISGLGRSLPLNDVDQPNNDSETRLIVPPEMKFNYFELLKNKSENLSNSTKAEKAEKADTPINFLRSSEDEPKNVSAVVKEQPALVAFEGSKQTPIFITIPIFITTDSQGSSVVAPRVDQSSRTISRIPHILVQRSVKSEEKPQPLNRHEQSSESKNKVLKGRHFRIKGRYLSTAKVI